MPSSAAPNNLQAVDIPELKTVQVPDAAGSNVAGLRLAYREAGSADAPALVFMHGIGSNSSGYRNQFSPFSDGFHVVSWDAPGYCGSSHFGIEAPRTSDYADALSALLDALGIDTCHIAGSSMGAVIAASFAARYPARARTMTLVAPATGNRRLEPEDRAAQLASRISDLEAYGPEGLADRRASALVSPDATEPVLAAAREVVAGINPRGYSQAARMLADADIIEDVMKVDVPTLILVGSNDGITPAESCAKPICEATRGAELHVLEGVGHLIKLEAPDRFNDMLRAFIERNQ